MTITTKILSLTFLVSVLFSLSTMAQSLTLDTTFSNDSAAVRIYQDARLNTLIEKSGQKRNWRKTKARGYRIQIYSGNNRQKAVEIQRLFVRNHPETSAYLTYTQPNFRVRIGDFKTRGEASKFLSSIRGQFIAMIVPSQINLR